MHTQTEATQIRELTVGETHLAPHPMRELRTSYDHQDQFVGHVDRVLRPRIADLVDVDRREWYSGLHVCPERGVGHVPGSQVADTPTDYLRVEDCAGDWWNEFQAPGLRAVFSEPVTESQHGCQMVILGVRVALCSCERHGQAELANLRRCVPEIARCLKPGGRLIGTAFFSDVSRRARTLFEIGARRGHPLPPGRHDLLRWLTDAGLSDPMIGPQQGFAAFSARKAQP